MQRLSMHSVVAALVLAATVTGCGRSPSYPPDWTPLSPAANTIGGADCPDLTGTYALPRRVPTYGRKERGGFVDLNRFLGVNPYQLDSGRVLRSKGPAPKMRLEGPDADGLRVTFFDEDDQTIRVKALRIGSDFACLGAWIGDAEPEHTRAKPRHYYAKDSQGRLIGHKAFTGGGLTLLYGIIPLAAFVDDEEWWRIEPAAP